MEKTAVMPLNGREVLEAILYKLAEDMEKSCHLSEQNAYTSFRAKIRVEIVLSDYGRETPDNHEIQESVGEPEGEPVAHEFEIEPAPPNEVRVSTDQDVPVVANENGRKVIKKVKYQKRKVKEVAQ